MNTELHGYRTDDRNPLARAARAIAVAALLAAALPAGGCVYSYENHDLADLDDMDFQGFAEFAGATVEIQAYHKIDEEWVTVATAVASSSPIGYGQEELYPWSRFNFDFTTVPDFTCYWGSDTACGFNPDGSAMFRFKQNGGALTYLSTFDQGGIDCVTTTVAQGKDWISAGYECQSEDSPVLHLHVIG